MRAIRKFIDLNIKLSMSFDKLCLPPSFNVDGNHDFLTDMAPGYLKSGMKVYDVGGGKSPFISTDQKMTMDLFVVGIDISQKELKLAPFGAYDEIVCADIASTKGDQDGDLVICQAVLEHVRDVDGAFKSIASLLKPGGTALIFVPSRNAVFARINLILPQKLKEKILYGIFPSTQIAQGFPSFYNKCTPNEFRALMKQNGLRDVEVRYYFVSTYFTFFFPLHFVWRIWILLFRILRGGQAAETFSMALVKKGN